MTIVEFKQRDITEALNTGKRVFCPDLCGVLIEVDCARVIGDSLEVQRLDNGEWFFTDTYCIERDGDTPF